LNAKNGTYTEISEPVGNHPK